jgi:Domain of unknown function (DUF5666)
MIRTLVVLVCTTLIASLTFAHGNERHVIGTVAKVSQGSVTVETIAKANIEVMITSDTKFTKGDASAALKDLQFADRVVIHAMPMKDGKLMAHTVQIGVAKASAHSH